MKRFQPIGNPGHSGLALLWALLIAFAAGSSAMVALSLATTGRSIAETDRSAAQSRSLSRGAVSIAEEALANALRSGLVPEAAGQQELSGHPVNWTLAADGAVEQVADGSGLTAMEQLWRVEGRAVIDGRPITTRRVVQARLIPIFQFALYYEGDMHFLYPAPMVVKGPVHCNGNVYLQAHKGLKFDTNYVKVAGEVYGGAQYNEWFKDYPWGDAGPVTIRKWVADPMDASEPVAFDQLESQAQMAAQGFATSGGYDANFKGYDKDSDGFFNSFGEWLPFAPGVLEKFGPPTGYPAAPNQSTLETHSHGVKPVISPKIDDFALFTPDAATGDHVFDTSKGTWNQVPLGTGTHSQGSYAQAAGLKVVVDSKGDFEAFDLAGNDITKAVDKAFKKDKLYDARQAEGSKKPLESLTVDLGLLASLGHFPSNGLLYLASEDPGQGADLQAFQIKNGSLLQDKLMVVSPDAVYLQGDFNTVNSKPCGVMADAVNLLSNSWDNNKQPGKLPTATPTTFNLSILTGDTLATAGQFNGGPHNLVRLHENWSGKTLSIEGSLVCLGPSKWATGAFHVYGDFYQAPNRDWRFDPDLSDPKNLPPFTPAIVEVTGVVEL